VAEVPRLSTKFQLVSPQDGTITPDGLHYLTQLGNGISSDSEDTDVEELEALAINRVRSVVGNLAERLEALEMASLVSPSEVAALRNRIEELESLA
jgi:hypothetical protein